jgi:phosphoribosylamine---glycine ligase
MFSEDKLYTLEYNIRMGDPEAQVLIEHLDCDLLEIFYLLAKRKVNKINIKYKEGTALGVIIADKDYINNKLDNISRTIKLPSERNLTYLFSNTVISNNEIEYHKAERILTICNNDVKNPAPAIYKEIEKIQALNNNIYYRTDIGKEFLE